MEGRYFDGKTGEARAATVRVGDDDLIIELAGSRVVWPGRKIWLVSRDDREIRLGLHGGEERLVLPAAAHAALAEAFPELLSGRRERRRMTIVVSALFIGAAAATAGVFFGVPAISGPLAEMTPKAFEKRLGDNLMTQIDLMMEPCTDEDAARAVLGPTLESMATAGEVGFDITFHVAEMEMPNAFALPGGHVLATSGLFDALKEDQEAFLAVMAHELGHVRARDSMQAVYRNAGIGIALEATTGGSGLAQQAVLLAGQMQQMRHSRRQETEADETAAEILAAADLDPAALARALDGITRIAEALEVDADEGSAAKDHPDILDWLSSHPNTQDRVAAARAKARPGGPAPLSAQDWQKLTKACAVENENISPIERVLDPLKPDR